MKTEIKNKELELPPGLPELPKERFLHKIRNSADTQSDFDADAGVEFKYWEIIELLELAEAIPAAPPVVEGDLSEMIPDSYWQSMAESGWFRKAHAGKSLEDDVGSADPIDPAVRLNIEAQMMPAVYSNGARGDAAVSESLELADALIAAARKQPDKNDHVQG